MSIYLYLKRVFWDTNKGGVMLDGACKDLTSPPAIKGMEALHLDGIDYAPEVLVAMVREKACAWRDMTPHETALVEAFLSSFDPNQ
jgi:hypothetical protein